MSCRQSPPPLSLARMVRSLRGHAAVTETKTNLSPHRSQLAMLRDIFHLYDLRVVLTSEAIRILLVFTRVIFNGQCDL